MVKVRDIEFMNYSPAEIDSLKIRFQFKRNIKNHKKIMRNKEKIHLLAYTTISHYITL